MVGPRYRPFSRHPRLRIVLLAVVLLGLAVYRLFQPVGRFEPGASLSPGFYRVQRVIDGDTLLLENGARVRLLGVDTPEIKHADQPAELLGRQAAEFTRKHVEDRVVRLEFDRERRDDYHRILAYVYRDDWFLNEGLIRAGYSEAETAFPYSRTMKRRFRTAEQEARQKHRGLWGLD